ncbi:hypothetical protein ACFP1I_06125 [Dyadobacter subterraneus]|uniref:ABC transporter permease n=1 Tax=Dyadobacter subterraneus TaxID=2773304 RepID=A0ABR9WFL3_9BACT|nr:hypothetical protein [Dyadobacter subterraneus]MBE9464295.1 hypothetical protein [Dyadobacter subterraneus]
MNQTFDFHRFGLMLKLDLAEKGRNNLAMASLLVVVLLFFMLPITTSNTFKGFYEALHHIALFMILLLGSSLYTSSVFTPYASQSTGMASLMIPASTLEKFLSTLLLNLLFIVPFLFLFFELHLSTVNYANSKISADGYKYHPLSSDVIQYTCYSYALIQGSIFLGSIYFSKASYIKSAACAIAIFVIIAAVQINMANTMTGSFEKVNTFPFTGWKMWNFGKNFKFYEVNYPENFQILVNIFPVLILLSLWFITYLRLKEKEI